MWDLVVIGSGPAGQKAAIQAAKAGYRVALVERERQIGGACVHAGTIPSKALREQALRQRDRPADLARVPLAELLANVGATIQAHDRYMTEQLARNAVTLIRGRASLLESMRVGVDHIDGSAESLAAKRILIASGSRPRAPSNLTIDHEHVLDSDSILSLAYLPRSLLVLGGGVIASEYAATFAALGTRVVQADRGAQPLAFIDSELCGFYLAELQRQGSEFWGGHTIESLGLDAMASVHARFSNHRSLTADKVLVALGRVANVEHLRLDAAGVSLTQRGDIAVDERFQTTNPAIYAAGDVIGPPALASTAMEQGRRAACAALGIAADAAPLPPRELPAGIYAIPEMATVGLDEAAARAAHGDVVIGRARFREIARGQLGGGRDGLLKMIATDDEQRILGIQIVGDGATELIHIGQMGLSARADVATYVDTVFNFPTMAEAYRVAALDIVRQRGTKSALHGRGLLNAHA
jgi:NAD(P) transhydrogenase